MIKLTDILRDVLIEAKAKKLDLTRGSKEGPIRPQSLEAVENSIKHRWLLSIYYLGDAENSAGFRWIEPLVLGIHRKSGNKILRAWQYRGQTLTPDNFPFYRMFRMDRIKNTAPLTNATFNKPRPEYNPHDKDMSKILARVNFGSTPDDEKGGDKEPNKPTGGSHGATTSPGGSVDINSPEIKKTAGILRSNTKDGKVDFDTVDKDPVFKDSKMRRALDVLKKMLKRTGSGIIKGLQNLHLKEDLNGKTED